MAVLPNPRCLDLLAALLTLNSALPPAMRRQGDNAG